MGSKSDLERKIHRIGRKEQAFFQNPPSEGADERVGLYYEALTDANGEKNLALLKKEGVDLSEENSTGEDLILLLEEHLAKTAYPNSKKGTLEKRKDERILKELRRMKADGTLAGTGKKRRRLYLAVLLALILLLAVTCFGVSYRLFSGSEDTSTAIEATESGSQ